MSLQNWVGLAFALSACGSAISIAVAYRQYLKEARASWEDVQKTIDKALEPTKKIPDEGSIQDILASTRKSPSSH